MRTRCLRRWPVCESTVDGNELQRSRNLRQPARLFKWTRSSRQHWKSSVDTWRKRSYAGIYPADLSPPSWYKHAHNERIRSPASCQGKVQIIQWKETETIRRVDTVGVRCITRFSLETNDMLFISARVSHDENVPVRRGVSRVLSWKTIAIEGASIPPQTYWYNLTQSSHIIC